MNVYRIVLNTPGEIDSPGRVEVLADDLLSMPEVVDTWAAIVVDGTDPDVMEVQTVCIGAELHGEQWVLDLKMTDILKIKTASEAGGLWANALTVGDYFAGAGVAAREAFPKSGRMAQTVYLNCALDVIERRWPHGIPVDKEGRIVDLAATLIGVGLIGEGVAG